MSALSLRTLLEEAPDDRYREVLLRWRQQDRRQHPEDNGHPDLRVTVRVLCAAMTDEELVARRLQELPEKLAKLLELFLRDADKVLTVRELFSEHGRSFKSRFDLEASLAALAREGFLFAGKDTRWASFEEPCYAIPEELAAGIHALRRRLESELRETITLKGWLDSRYFEKQQADDERAAEHARKIYRFYLMEGSIRSRVRQLPEPVKKVFLHALTHYGGLMPVEQIAVELDLDPVPDRALVHKCLEEAMLGTVAPLRLARFGIQPVAHAVVLFQEIVLVGLPLYSSVHGVEVGAALCGGVDLVSNVGRFLRELQQSKVQFTVEGELYKASQKRIMGAFLEIAGGFMPPETQIRTIYRFCLARRLIDRSGERALRPTQEGLDFERRELIDKLRLLLDYFVDEQGLPGELFHQVRLRRILLRLFQGLEPEQWHDVLFLPFLARNSYLTQLEKQNAEGFFAGRFRGGGYTPTEDLQQICWNLLLFIKRRLYPLGIVDLGMQQGRPVALRLSRLGAELLAESAAEPATGEKSSVVVNPDFEVILFPGDDEHEAVHLFDRFAHRLKSDHIHHFKLDRDSLQSGLRDGLGLTRILGELEERSRTPLPQNVIYSLQEWADLAGLLTLDGRGRVHGRREEVLARFLELAQVRDHVVCRESPFCARLEQDVPWAQLDPVLRDLGFLVERAQGGE